MRTPATFLVVLGLAAMPTYAARDDGGITVGTVRPYHAETPHPYPRGLSTPSVVWTDTVVADGAEFLRVHFDRFSLAEGDYVTVSSPDRTQQWRYEGRGPNGDGDIWAFTIDGDTAVVELHSSRKGGHGYRIDAIAYGTSPLGRNVVPVEAPPPYTRTICNQNEFQEAICHHSAGAYDAVMKATAKLTYVNDVGLVKTCTGWLVDGSKRNLLMTNNHCIDTKPEVLSLQARFNYHYTDCSNPTTLATTTDYPGKALIKTNTEVYSGTGGLDYTLLTLSGNAEDTWGELTPVSQAHSVGEQFYIVGHPGGLPQRVTWWEDTPNVDRCTTYFVDRTYVSDSGSGGQSAPNTQMGYICDTVGGSSGSPVVNAGSGKVFGLHHWGAQADCDEFGQCQTCVNAATEMGFICADAGSLLNCDPS